MTDPKAKDMTNGEWTTPEMISNSELADMLENMVSPRYGFIDEAAARLRATDWQPIESADDERTPEEWLADSEFVGCKILDPDGWRFRTFAGDAPQSWDAPISKAEFVRRMAESTVMLASRCPDSTPTT